MPGKVKTRIAAETGDDAAAEIYSELVRHFWEKAIAPLDLERFEIVACCDPMGTREQYLAAFPFLPKAMLRQQGRDLGERMANVFRTLCPAPGATIPGYRATMIVGTDCVAMETHHFDEAECALSDHSLVLGPATDGGYYLIGARECFGELFRGIAWSTDRVLAQTKEIADSLGLRTKELGPLSDVDTLKDWKASGVKIGKSTPPR